MGLFRSFLAGHGVVLILLVALLAAVADADAADVDASAAAAGAEAVSRSAAAASSSIIPVAGPYARLSERQCAVAGAPSIAASDSVYGQLCGMRAGTEKVRQHP